MNRQNGFQTFFNLIHTLIVLVFCLIVSVMHRLSPVTILPKLTLPVMAATVLVALAVETYVKGRVEKRFLLPSVAIATAIFTIFPYVNGMTGNTPLWQYAVGGALMSFFGILLYDAVIERTFADGKKHLLAPVGNALMLFLASQALYSIF